MQVSARDEGGGLLRFFVLVDGSIAMEDRVEDVAPSCRAPFVKVVPCAGSAARTLAFDTTTIPNGKHSIQIAVDDVAGNLTISPAVEHHHGKRLDTERFGRVRERAARR